MASAQRFDERGGDRTAAFVVAAQTLRQKLRAHGPERGGLAAAPAGAGAARRA